MKQTVQKMNIILFCIFVFLYFYIFVFYIQQQVKFQQISFIKYQMKIILSPYFTAKYNFKNITIQSAQQLQSLLSLLSIQSIMNMSSSIEESSRKKQINIKQKSKNLLCLQQSIQLPSNLLQQRKNVLQQFRNLSTTHQTRSQTPREPLALMSKTFSHTRENKHINPQKFEVLIEQRVISSQDQNKSKVVKNPLYKRLCDIQAESKQLSGISFSKLLSRMLIIQTDEKNQVKPTSQYRRKKPNNIQSKLKSIPNYQCLESKMFTIECPESKRYTSENVSPKRSLNISPFKSIQPVSNRLFRRYFNPHGQQNEANRSYQNIQFDQRYIYRNGKKTQCKRIHNFYTSNMFKKSYEKHMRNTIDGFNPSKTTKY